MIYPPLFDIDYVTKSGQLRSRRTSDLDTDDPTWARIQNSRRVPRSDGRESVEVFWSDRACKKHLLAEFESAYCLTVLLGTSCAEADALLLFPLEIEETMRPTYLQPFRIAFAEGTPEPSVEELERIAQLTREAIAKAMHNPTSPLHKHTVANREQILTYYQHFKDMQATLPEPVTTTQHRACVVVNPEPRYEPQ